MLYSFQGGADGSSPVGVTLGANGQLFGVTQQGGANTCGFVEPGCGTVFELTSAKGGGWTKADIHDFNGVDGAQPAASPVLGHAGVLYGTALHGGDDYGGLLGGTVFKLAPPSHAGAAWTETVLYNFSRNYGPQTSPAGELLIGPNGSLYGAAFNGDFTPISGAPDGGVVYTLTPPTVTGGDWTDSIVFNFVTMNTIGLGPDAGVIPMGQSLYGTNTYNSYSDYTFSGCGTVYQLSPPAAAGGAWTGTAIYTFQGGSDGCNSVAPLTAGPGGVLYGTTNFGGVGDCAVYSNEGCGTVFQLTPPAAPGGSWTESVIYRFTALNDDGAYPTSGVVLGKNGVIYGSTSYGGGAAGTCFYWGATGCGAVFQLTPPAAPGGTWTETTLHSFTGSDGSGPEQLILSPDGVLYGVTSGGGTAGQGAVFSVAP